MPDCLVDKTITQEAIELISGIKADQYDAPERNFKRIALAWQALTDRVYTESEVCLMMCALKLVRESHYHKRDNVVDGIGYLLLANSVT